MIYCCIRVKRTYATLGQLHTIQQNEFYTIWKQYLFFFFFFLKKRFWRTHVLFWGHWYPCFGFLVMSPLGFKARVGSALFAIFFCRGECNVHSPRFTSGATLADLLAAGAQLVTSPHACAEVGLGSDSNVQPHEQKTNALPLCQRPGSWKQYLCDQYKYQFFYIIITSYQLFTNFSLKRRIYLKIAQKIFFQPRNIHSNCHHLLVPILHHDVERLRPASYLTLGC